MYHLCQLKINAVQGLEKLIGRETTHRLLLQFYVRTYKNHGIVFIHIPKAAGTSIANELYGKRAGHFSASKIRKAMGEHLYNKTFSFSVTRNPYTRILSAYCYAVEGGTSEGGIRNRGYYQQDCFSSFECFVREWLMKQDLHKADLMFRPQHQFIFDSSGCLVDFVGKLENMEEVEEVLSSQLDRKVEFSRMNRSSSRSSFRQCYNNSLYNCINHLYEKDFQLLGYEMH